MTNETASDDRDEATQRRAGKDHLCAHCRWKARRAVLEAKGYPLRASDVPVLEEHRIPKGSFYMECYAHGEDVFHPARYHEACWEEIWK